MILANRSSNRNFQTRLPVMKAAAERCCALILCCAGSLALPLTAAHARPAAATPVIFEPDMPLGGHDATTDGGRNETTVAVNPRDPSNLVAGFHDLVSPFHAQACRFASTRDGGRTWTLGGTAPLEANAVTCFDPTMAADARGNFYYSYGQFSVDAAGIETYDLLVAKSTDGGESFPTFTVAGRYGVVDPDKPVIAADAWSKSRFKGTLYLAFLDLLGYTGTEIRVVVSRDGGATWSAPVRISRTVPTGGDEGVHGPMPVVAPDGTVYVFYAEGIRRGRGPFSLKFASSADGGRTWSPPADVASGLPSPIGFKLRNSSPQFGTATLEGVSANSFPTAAAAADGTLYVAWVDFPNGSCIDLPGLPACTNSDVRLSVSRNGGRAWSPPVKVTDETNPTDQFLPWIAAHPGGVLSLVWLDKRLDSQNQNYDTFYTNTPDARVFLPNVRVSSESSIIGQATFIGDYNGLAVTEKEVFPIWGDLRSRDHVEIFTTRGTLAVP